MLFHIDMPNGRIDMLLQYMPHVVMPGRALLHQIEDRDGARRLRQVPWLGVGSDC
jgi:hypothetical protein